jgi:hypothetical protein
MLPCDETVSTGDIKGIIFFAGTNIPVAGVTIDVDGNRTFSSEEAFFPA